ncbi:MAG: DUF3696 domain-containing protein [Deltaproteobacteria bacterium]|nr:DUF3696 domain-containing protein [Deltaproteobacteria bacterium]
MQIDSFGCNGYKAFKHNVSIDVKPLTIIIGKNNSGKSNILRLPRLIVRALANDANSSFPLEAEGLRFGEFFRDLVYNRQANGKVSFSLRVNENSEILDFTADILNVGDVSPGAGRAMIRRLIIREPVAKILEWDGNSIDSPRYGTHGEVTFTGLFPVALPEWEFLNPWRVRAKLLEQEIGHLGPIRQEIQPSVRASAGKKLGLDGDAAVLWLAEDDELLEVTSQWMKTNMDGWELGILRQGNNIECEASRSGVRVNLAQAGQGIQQLLPIVVQQLFGQKQNQGQRLFLVEQPELHLHGAAEAPLGDLFVNTAQRNNGTSVIVETHSENLLLRVRRRIAEGEISPDLVALYWVEEHADGSSVAKPISISENGEVDWWPQGIFAEGYEEVRAIRQGQRRRFTENHQ